MDPAANLKLTRLLVSMIWLFAVLSSVISLAYPLSSSADVDQDAYEPESPLMDDVRWLQYLLRGAKDPRLSETKRPEDPTEVSQHVGQKRMQFGFSGLDTLDHILTTLDRKPKPGGSGEKSGKTDKDIYYLMKVNG